MGLGDESLLYADVRSDTIKIGHAFVDPLADLYAAADPAFDRAGFLAACGLEPFTADDAHHALTGE